MLDRPATVEEVFTSEETVASNLHQSAKEHLRAFVERIETLETQKAEVAEDIKQVYEEAKGNGFDAKIIRKIIALRKKPEHERAEEDAILSTYLIALGMVPELLSDGRRIGEQAAD